MRQKILKLYAFKVAALDFFDHNHHHLIVKDIIKFN